MFYKKQKEQKVGFGHRGCFQQSPLKFSWGIFALCTFIMSWRSSV